MKGTNVVKYQITACDRCGTEENVSTWVARRGNRKFPGDLCEECWNDLLKIFQPSAGNRGRHEIVITHIDDIPKK